MPTLALILFVLQLADLISTAMLLRESGFKESNPIMAKVMDKLGVLPALFVTKGLACAAIVWLYPAPVYVLAPLVIIYGWVVANNLRYLLK